MGKKRYTAVGVMEFDMFVEFDDSDIPCRHGRVAICPSPC